MRHSSILFVLVGFLSHKSCASEADLQKLCEGQRYGTLVPNPKDCNSFYVCQFVVQLTRCDIGLHFDRRNKVCNWPQFAGCDWVEAESGSSVEILPVEKPEKPIPDEDKYPETDFEPEKPLPGEDPIPSDEGDESDDKKKPIPDEDKYPETDFEPEKPGEKPIPSDGDNDSDDKQEPNPGEETKPTGDNNSNQPSSAEKTSEEGGNLSWEEHSRDSEESKSVTEDDVITKKPYTPSSSSSHSSQEETITGKGVTEDDFITNKPYSPNPSSGEDQDHKFPSTDGDDSSEEDQLPFTDGDIITISKEDPAPWKPDPTPDEHSSESSELIPDLPKPNHPPTSEEIDPKPSEGSQDSSEKLPTIEDHNPGDLKPPFVDGSVDKPDPGLFVNYTSQHWNLIASMASVASSKDSFINRPIVGAHSTETGYPVDVMTGYDPSNVQCLHNGLYFLPHPGNCQKYFICAYRHLHLHSCGSGVIWNHKREQCDLKGYAKCYSRDGDQEVTTEFITPPVIEESTEKSTQEATTITQTTTTRKPTTKTTKLPPTTIGHRLPLCPMTRQVYLPNLDDCRRYFICIMGKPVLTSCPSGMHWDAIGEFCGKPTVVRCAHR